MTAIIFPAALPNPSVSVLTPAERRLLSDVTGGPQQARGLQRDYLATQRVEWAILTDAEADALNTWWRDTLTSGGAWFASIWPVPQGWVSVARRFVGAPQWSHLPGGFWKVAAQVQVRGRGLDPRVCFYENFSSGLAPYTVTSGSVGIFGIVTTAYGPSLRVAPQSGGSAYMQRPLGGTIVASAFSARFMVDSFNSDDGAVVELYGAGVRYVGMLPRVAAPFDSLQRAQLVVDSESIFLTAGSVISGAWYQLDLVIATGVGNTIATLTKLSDGSVVSITPLTVSHSPPSVDALRFTIDSATTTSAITYDDVRVC